MQYILINEPNKIITIYLAIKKGFIGYNQLNKFVI